MDNKDIFKSIVDRSINEITIPSTINNIGERIFSGCNNLTNVTIPNSIIRISENAFYACGFTEIEIPNSVEEIQDYAFSYTKLTETTIPDSVINLGKEAFSYCRSLNSVEVGAKNIKDSAFLYCDKLTNLTIKNGVLNIDKMAFNTCSNLIEVIIPDSVVSIGDNAFTGCSSLKTVTIGSGVTNIGQGVFLSSLVTMTLETITFRQPSGMNVTLPTAGDSTGMLYSKTARQMTIYTDNETIKNYDYATDNITATILHLDGSAWN